MQIVKLRFRSPRDFSESYIAEGSAGALFCPTTTELTRGEEVIVELAAAELPNKIMLRGEVQWWRPALPRLRVRAGAQVSLLESERAKRDFLLQCFGESVGRPLRKRKHVRLPVDIPVRYRIEGSADFVESDLSEISAGGALLLTPDGPLPLETPVILELRIPGGVGDVQVSGKVTYHAGREGTGIKFLYRDGGGSRRLRELVTRLRRR